VVKIPVYEQKVGMQNSATTATTALAAPTPTSAPKESFGTAVAEANIKSGEMIDAVGGLVSRHVIQKKQDDDRQAVLDASTAFQRQLQNLVYNDEKDANGNVVRQGLLNRPLGSAKGSDEELANTTKQLKADYLKTLPWPGQQQMFNQLADSHYIGVRDQVLRHESDQLNKDKMNSLKASVDAGIDEAGYNPSGKVIDRIITDNTEATRVFMKAQGFDDTTIKAQIIENNDKVVSAAIDTAVRTNNDYKLGDAIIERYKSVISPKIYDAAKLDIKQKSEFDRQMTYNNEVFSKYGMDLAGADKAILADTKLAGPDKERQLSAYHSFLSMKKQEESIADDNAMKNAMNQLDAIHKGSIEVPGSGYAAAIKYANTLPVKTRTHILPLVEQLFGANEVKTDPAAWYTLYDKVKDGTITNKWQMMKEFGDRISFSDMKSFINAVDSGQGATGSEFNKFSITTAVNKLLKDKNLESPEDQAQMWEYVSAKSDDFVKVNGRKPTPTEQAKILKESMDSVVVGKAWVGDKKLPAFRVPVGAIYSPAVGSMIKRDANGNFVKWVPK